MRRSTVRVTRHFARNLDAIETFLREADATPAFASLLDDLFGETIPTLERFPDLGSDFFRRRSSSREAAALAAKLRERLGSETTLRELVRGDYLMLYARCEQHIYLLAIKHHRQFSFDFQETWDSE